MHSTSLASTQQRFIADHLERIHFHRFKHHLVFVGNLYFLSRIHQCGRAQELALVEVFIRFRTYRVVFRGDLQIHNKYLNIPLLMGTRCTRLKYLHRLVGFSLHRNHSVLVLAHVHVVGGCVEHILPPMVVQVVCLIVAQAGFVEFVRGLEWFADAIVVFAQTVA